MQDGVAYPVGALVPNNDPCKDGCYCHSSGDILCMWAKSHRSCASFLTHPPCVDAVQVHDPTQCCPVMTCPNGPNCRVHPSGQIIPVGVQVEVDGRQCYCSPESAGFQVMCPTSPPTTTTTTTTTTPMTPARPTTSTTT
ncbi:uncharacterized protein LOC118415854 [Branchiostoma floridae]|nr:uncharacterized protein LOC118415854 [Branchiostoma floridae]